MRLLILGGTAWLGRELASQAVARDSDVTCLARGTSGDVPAGARWVRADRDSADAYEGVAGQTWDAVVDLTWQPGHARSAVTALADSSGHWCTVSSVSVYADHSAEGADESAATLAPLAADEAGLEDYGSAKVACEQAAQRALGDRLLVARCGLIGGAGDHTGRSGSWVARAARAPQAPMLVPDAPGFFTQAVDVHDVARWILDSAAAQLTGTFDVVGPVVPFDEWVQLSREVGGHQGPVVTAEASWLLDRGVGEWAGQGSLALWIADPQWRGFGARSGAAALAAGLNPRAYQDLLHEVLAYERSRDLRPPCGLDDEVERDLVEQLSNCSRDQVI